MSEAIQNDTSHDVEAYIKRGYLGEIAGEIFFLKMADHHPEHREKLEMLARVEGTTAADLRPHLSAAPTEAEITQAKDRGNDLLGFSEASWTEMLTKLGPYIDDAVDRMRAAEAEAPPEMASVYARFTAHEQALADFITLELGGEESTAPLRAYLGE